MAIAMGNYYFTSAADGSKTKVEYTFGYKKNADGKVRIFLHHSSVPFVAPEGERTRAQRQPCKSEAKLHSPCRSLELLGSRFHPGDLVILCIAAGRRLLYKSSQRFGQD